MARRAATSGGVVSEVVVVCPAAAVDEPDALPLPLSSSVPLSLPMPPISSVSPPPGAPVAAAVVVVVVVVAVVVVVVVVVVGVVVLVRGSKQTKHTRVGVSACLRPHTRGSSCAPRDRCRAP